MSLPWHEVWVPLERGEVITLNDLIGEHDLIIARHAQLWHWMHVLDAAANWGGRFRDGDEWDRELEAREKKAARTMSNKLRTPMSGLTKAMGWRTPRPRLSAVSRDAATHRHAEWAPEASLYLRVCLEDAAGVYRDTRDQTIQRWGHYLERVHTGFCRGIDALGVAPRAE